MIVKLINIKLYSTKSSINNEEFRHENCSSYRFKLKALVFKQALCESCERDCTTAKLAGQVKQPMTYQC